MLYRLFRCLAPLFTKYYLCLIASPAQLHKHKPYFSKRYIGDSIEINSAKLKKNIIVNLDEIDLRYITKKSRLIITSRATSTVGWCIFSSKPVIYIENVDNRLNEEASKIFQETFLKNFKVILKKIQEIVKIFQETCTICLPTVSSLTMTDLKSSNNQFINWSLQVKHIETSFVFRLCFTTVTRDVTISQSRHRNSHPYLGRVGIIYIKSYLYITIWTYAHN